MKAAYVERLGAEDNFTYGDLPDPEIGPRQVLIRVKAAGINRRDIPDRRRVHEGNPVSGVRPAQISFVVQGFEVAGVIESVGADVSDRRVGQRVVATTPGGGYAELVAVSRAGTVLLPDSLTFEEGASIPIVFLTSWYGLVKVARIQPEETVLIQSGGSGVGMAGIQISKYFKTKVITTAGTDEKVAKAINLGADLGINYQTQDFVPEVMRYTNGRGADLVLESVGGEVLTKSIKALARLGRVIIVGNSSGSSTMMSQFAGSGNLPPSAATDAVPDFNLLIQKSATIGGFAVSHQMAYGGVMAELEKIIDLCGQKKMRTVVDRVFPLAEASEAFQYVEQRRNFGKVILRP